MASLDSFCNPVKISVYGYFIKPKSLKLHPNIVFCRSRNYERLCCFGRSDCFLVISRFRCLSDGKSTRLKSDPIKCQGCDYCTRPGRVLRTMSWRIIIKFLISIRGKLGMSTIIISCLSVQLVRIENKKLAIGLDPSLAGIWWFSQAKYNAIRGF